MENKKVENMSKLGLVISLLPLLTLIPTAFNISLTGSIQLVWAGANIIFAFIGLMISIMYVKNRESRSAVNIVSTVISGFWILLMSGVALIVIFQNLLGR